jgi:leucyl-tRNA synthetase
MTSERYNARETEPHWQRQWTEKAIFASKNDDPRPKYYVLEMFPYPSGRIHIGHVRNYTLGDVIARYRRAKGFNVLHPMGWDSFGLPAEQYAVKTGQHPRQTTEANITTFKRQIKALGFSYDWSRELATTDTDYFKWTQWIFLKLYNSYFDYHWNKAAPIELLEDALSDYPKRQAEWNDNSHLAGTHDFYVGNNPRMSEASRRRLIDAQRLAYVSEQPVWWCEQLGTVLANEEVVDGKSEVGGFPVVRKPMRQWMLRITAYAERLIQDLDTIDWTDSLKEMQRNWIGRSEGAEVKFQVSSVQCSETENLKLNTENFITVFTTRPDTLFGATYMVLAPEHKLVDQITTAEQRDAVAKYKTEISKKSDLERTELAKEKSGVFTGAFAINPVNGEKIPIWIADYVLASYGTGAIMAVPAHDERDWEFAKKFNLQIKQVVVAKDLKPIDLPDGRKIGGAIGPIEKPFCEEGIAFESPESGWRLKDSFGERCDINGLPTTEAKKKITAWLEEKGLGKKTINFKLRDWLFSRQRYWGEPFPIVWKIGLDGQSYHEALPESALPVLPPSLTDYKPTATGEPPLARAKDWVNLPDGSVRETNTMPQWAGSCWYYLRYLDAKNNFGFVGKDVENYWMGATASRASEGLAQTSETLRRSNEILNPQSAIGNRQFNSPGVDLYVGGTEHAVLHLLYARFWHKVLFDLGFVSTPEPFFKLVNQGIILGEDGQKMSKSRGNVVNPDDVLGEYGADAFRLYEMFMGPLEMVKPWNTKGVEGVYRFLGRAWRLFVDEKSEVEFEQAEAVATEAQRHGELLGLIKLNSLIKDVAATPTQLKALHACIKKVTEDLDGMRFNTAISAMMVFVNDAITWETKPVSVLREFLILLQPFAPHIAEELWEKLNSSLATHHSSLGYAPWPKFNPELLVESEIELPVSVNGKVRDVIKIAADADNAAIEAAAKASEKVQSFIADKVIKKVIIVPKKMVNLIVG